jgi:hypothetical protein
MRRKMAEHAACHALSLATHGKEGWYAPNPLWAH